MTISECFEAFEIDELVSEGRSAKTIDAYRCTRNSLLRSLGSDINAAGLGYVHIIHWKKMMQERGNSGAHMALQLRELRRVLTYLRSHGFSSLDPKEIKIPKFKYNTTDWLTIDELTDFLSVIEKPRDKALFSSMFSSGARISELISLNRNSIINGQAQIWGKGKQEGREKPDVLHFDDNALSLIGEYLETRHDNLDPLFISRQNRRLCIQQCIVLSHKYAKLAGIEKAVGGKNVSTHVIRHSFGTDLELNGLDIHGVANQMRHKKIETTRIYMHGADLRKKPDYQRFHTPVPIC